MENGYLQLELALTLFLSEEHQWHFCKACDWLCLRALNYSGTKWHLQSRDQPASSHYRVGKKQGKGGRLQSMRVKFKTHPRAFLHPLPRCTAHLSKEHIKEKFGLYWTGFSVKAPSVFISLFLYVFWLYIFLIWSFWSLSSDSVGVKVCES